ncbi:helix-turn-helix domain-containing protein [Gallibacterium sp. ZY190522]
MEQILTIAEAASYLKCCENTVRKNLYNWGFFKPAGTRFWRVKKKDLEELACNYENKKRLGSVRSTKTRRINYVD